MDLLCFCSVLCMLCLCAHLFICALWSPARKGLTSWLSFLVSKCFFFFFALRPMSTAMVIAGWSVHLTTLFPGQA